MTNKKTEPTGLELLRKPFDKNQISKLPKPTKSQTKALSENSSLGIRCKVCGKWHHKNVIHLDYVGHAALTDRLLDCDPLWNWEPVAFDQNGLPAIVNGGMWIKLTVCGQTRLGYGDADGKNGGNAIKEIIGDALRNAAMRFGAALDLWHKGELHQDEEHEQQDETPRAITDQQFIDLRGLIEEKGVDVAAVLKRYSAESLEQFPPESYGKAMAALQKTALKSDENMTKDLNY